MWNRSISWLSEETDIPPAHMYTYIYAKSNIHTCTHAHIRNTHAHIHLIHSSYTRKRLRSFCFAARFSLCKGRFRVPFPISFRRPARNPFPLARRKTVVSRGRSLIESPRESEKWEKRKLVLRILKRLKCDTRPIVPVREETEVLRRARRWSVVKEKKCLRWYTLNVYYIFVRQSKWEERWEPIDRLAGVVRAFLATDRQSMSPSRPNLSWSLYQFLYCSPVIFLFLILLSSSLESIASREM